MMDPTIYFRFVLAALATWRVTHLLAHEDGPADVVVRLRIWLGQSFAGRLMDCFQCLSVWIAAPVARFVTRQPLDWFFSWIALSGAACLLERLGHKTSVIEPSTESQGESNHVLRTETGSFAE